MKYTVIVMRPEWFIDSVEDFDDLQSLQYVATGVEAEENVSAGKAACKEVFKADKLDLRQQVKERGPITYCGHDLRGLDWSDYTVLGTIDDTGTYRSWLNGTFP